MIPASLTKTKTGYVERTRRSSRPLRTVEDVDAARGGRVPLLARLLGDPFDGIPVDVEHRSRESVLGQPEADHRPIPGRPPVTTAVFRSVTVSNLSVVAASLVISRRRAPVNRLSSDSHGRRPRAKQTYATASSPASDARCISLVDDGP